MATLPSHARVVVIGGGIIGCSVAYHLAHLGWKDIVLVERDKLTSGTTWHAAGLIVTFGSTSETSTEMRKYTRDLYTKLEAETGQSTGFKPVGFIEVASERDRLEEYRRVSAFNRLLRRRRPGAVARAGQGSVPARGDLRHARRLLRQGRRPRQPGRRDDGAREGRAPRRRDARREMPGDRLSTPARRGRRRDSRRTARSSASTSSTAPACGRASSAPGTACRSRCSRRSTTT